MLAMVDPGAAGPAEILYVEDDADARELLESFFSRCGYRVHVAETVAEGLEVLASSGHFALVLADYNLPDGTGTLMIREARRRGLLTGTRLFLITAQAYPERDADVGLLEKPTRLSTLLELAASATGRPARRVH